MARANSKHPKRLRVRDYLLEFRPPAQQKPLTEEQKKLVSAQQRAAWGARLGRSTTAKKRPLPAKVKNATAAHAAKKDATQ